MVGSDGPVSTMIDATATASWIEANQRHLSAAVAAVRVALERQIARVKGELAGAPDGVAPLPDAATGVRSSPPALDLLCAAFGLSPFERDVLVLCAAMDLDGAIAGRCALAAGDATRAYPTFGLALAALPEPHWSALTPDAPLRRWRLIEVGSGSALTLSPLRVDERILHYLAGVPHLDARLTDLIVPLTAREALVPSHRAIVQRIATAWQGDTAAPLMQLCGVEAASKRAIAAATCAAAGLRPYLLPAELLPTAPNELHLMLELWARETRLGGAALVLACEEADLGDAARRGAVVRLVERLAGPAIVTSRDRLPLPQRPALVEEVRKPERDEQRVLWHAALGATAIALNGQVDGLVTQFSLGATAIRNVGIAALGQRDVDAGGAALGQRLWDACRIQTRPQLDDLAERIESVAGWDDLVLPELQRRTLREIAAHLRQRATVYETWGFAGKGARGLGISALFAGASGTGKTMAAEVLARELRLDLYRIDLSSVVSKYIGETEKNLHRIFDMADEGGTILLFDEADALFGKRSEVKDSHDRYANIEVSYLLQRIETYRGLAILTTNLKSALDTAFLRRIRFVVSFPFPDSAQRAEIWRHVFPSATPTVGLEPQRLAQLNVAGGNIRNIALNAAFLAADEGEPVMMRHVLAAARSEYAKLEKALTGVEAAAFG